MPIGVVVAATIVAATGVGATIVAGSSPPARFSWQGQTHQVETIARQWRVHIDWWREPTWRAYYKLTTTSGLLVVIYHELPAGEWFLQRLYD